MRPRSVMAEDICVMNQKMKVACIVGENNWQFFEEIYRDLVTCYETTVFRKRQLALPFWYYRINRLLLDYDLGSLLRSNDVAFFEWASEFLVAATTRQPKRCKIITRLLGWELYEWAPRINWERVDRIIVLLDAVRNTLVQLYPQCEGKVVVINQGEILNNFKPVSRRFGGTVGTLGYLTPRKRVYELILTLSELIQRGYDLQLRIAGKPPTEQFQRDYVAIRRLPEKLGIQDRVIFDGYVPDAAQWYHEIDIFVSNSYWETQHVALQEAMASGCYCLAHFWDGIEEILPPGCTFGTNAELGEKIIAYCKAPQTEKQQLQARMRAIVEEKFDIEQTKAQIRQVIEEVANA